MRIVVLGGGFGGMYTARALKRRLGDKAQVELINAENYFVFQPLLPEVGAGSIAPVHAVSPLRFILKGVYVRKALIDSVDFERKVVIVFQGIQRRPTEVPFDHLVIALGQGTDFSRMPGLEEHALKMKTLEDARRLRLHVIEQLEHAQVTNMADTKRGALTFTVVGGGFSGVETVGEMKELIDRSLPYYPSIDPSEVRVNLVEFAPRILNEMPEKLADYAVKHLEKHGVRLMLNTGVQSCTHRQLVTNTGEVIDTRTIVATIGNAPLDVVRRMDLPESHGRIMVDRAMRVDGREDIWALGDCALIPMKDGASERGDFAPPTAQFAVREADRVARNIAAVLEGQSPEPFAYKSKGALASLGARRGVADLMGMKIKGFPAWVIWRAYYLALIPGLGTKFRVMMNWLLDLFFARSLVQLQSFRKPPVRHVYFRAGDRIYSSGDRADGFYTVLSGAVEMDRKDPETGLDVTRTIGPGGHFGERMLLGATRRHTTVRAAEDTKVLVMNRAEFFKLYEGFDAFSDYFRPYMEKHGVPLEPPEDTAEKTGADKAPAA